MGKLNISELRQGMVIGQPIFSKDGNQLLLKIGTRLTDSLIQYLKKAEISQVEIKD